MRIFVTGASGVIGRRLVPALVHTGHEVSASVRSAEQAAQLARGGVRALVLSLFDRTALDAALAHQQVVINLATRMPASTFKIFLPGAWRPNDRLRRVASAKLVEAGLASGAVRFIQEYFAPAYPDCGRAWISETTALAALELPAGTYNIADDEPLTHRDYLDALAGAPGAAPPKFAPAWLAILAGSLGELLSRSQRISNRALRAASPWQLKYPSARSGWTATVQGLHSRG